MRLKSSEIMVIRKHGHLFEDEDSIKDAIVLGFSTVKSAVHPEATEKICDQIEKFSGYHVNCVTYEADRKDNDLRLSDDDVPAKLMMLKVRSLILLIWSNQTMDDLLEESEEEELVDEVDELREVDDDGDTVIEDEGQSMFLTEESEDKKKKDKKDKGKD